MRTDRIISGLTLLLATVYLYATSRIPTLEIGDPLGPKAFPILLGIALVLGAILLVIETLRAHPADTGEKPRESLHHLWLIGGVTLWTVLYFSVFDAVGYLVSTSVYLLVMTGVFNRGKWIANVLTSILFTIGSYVLFVKILGVVLPRGILSF